MHAESADVLIGLVVDENGNPTRIRILRSIGLGMDEEAVQAVQQYRLRPAHATAPPSPQLPKMWQDFGQRYVAPDAGSLGPPLKPTAERVGGDAKPPGVLAVPEPNFNDHARAMKFEERSTISLIVDDNAQVTNVT